MSWKDAYSPNQAVELKRSKSGKTVWRPGHIAGNWRPTLGGGIRGTYDDTHGPFLAARADEIRAA
jgi:hypothetical protein